MTTPTTRLSIDPTYGAEVKSTFVEHAPSTHPDNCKWTEEFAAVAVVVDGRRWTLKKKWSLTGVADAEDFAQRAADRIAVVGTIDPSLWSAGRMTYGYPFFFAAN